MRCSRASLVRSTSSWAQKSKSICSARSRYGIAPVVSPRAVTNSTMPHQWFDKRRERELHLADDLRPQMQRVAGVGPVRIGERGPGVCGRAHAIISRGVERAYRISQIKSAFLQGERAATTAVSVGELRRRIHAPSPPAISSSSSFAFRADGRFAGALILHGLPIRELRLQVLNVGEDGEEFAIEGARDTFVGRFSIFHYQHLPLLEGWCSCRSFGSPLRWRCGDTPCQISCAIRRRCLRGKRRDDGVASVCHGLRKHENQRLNGVSELRRDDLKGHLTGRLRKWHKLSITQQNHVSLDLESKNRREAADLIAVEIEAAGVPAKVAEVRRGRVVEPRVCAADWNAANSVATFPSIGVLFTICADFSAKPLNTRCIAIVLALGPHARSQPSPRAARARKIEMLRHIVAIMRHHDLRPRMSASKPHDFEADNRRAQSKRITSRAGIEETKFQLAVKSRIDLQAKCREDSRSAKRSPSGRPARHSRREIRASPASAGSRVRPDRARGSGHRTADGPMRPHASQGRRSSGRPRAGWTRSVLKGVIVKVPSRTPCLISSSFEEPRSRKDGAGSDRASSNSNWSQ